MRNGFRALLILTMLVLTQGCSSDSPFGLSNDVEAKVVNQIATLDYHYEIAIINHGVAPIFVERCHGVETRVGLLWVLVDHLSACASILPPERVEAGETFMLGVTLPSAVVTDEAPDGGIFRFVFVLTESEAFASAKQMEVRTGTFEL